MDSYIFSPVGPWYLNSRAPSFPLYPALPERQEGRGSVGWDLVPETCVQGVAASTVSLDVITLAVPPPHGCQEVQPGGSVFGTLGSPGSQGHPASWVVTGRGEGSATLSVVVVWCGFLAACRSC